MTLIHLVFWDKCLHGYFMELLVISIQYHVVFVLKEHMIFTVISSLTTNLLYKICSPVNNIVYFEGSEACKSNFKICYTSFCRIPSYKGFHSKAPLYYTVIHIHGQKYNLHHHKIQVLKYISCSPTNNYNLHLSYAAYELDCVSKPSTHCSETECTATKLLETNHITVGTPVNSASSTFM
jgi:hypothetical protein